MDRCYICGTELRETTHGRMFCPNCGIIEEESESKSEEKNNSSYIG